MKSEGLLLVMIVLCILAETGRELCFRHGATGKLFQTLGKRVVWGGIAFWILDLILWTRVLEEVPLVTAFPLIAASHITIAFASGTLFNETSNLRHALGVALVVLGVVCVGASEL